MAQNVFPIFKGAIYNTTKSENTAFFASDLLPTTTPTTFLVYYAGTTAGNHAPNYPHIRRSNGGNIVTENPGGGNIPFSFSNTEPVMFQFLVAPGDSINFIKPIDSGSANIVTLIVIEVETATGKSIFGTMPTRQ